MYTGTSQFVNGRDVWDKEVFEDFFKQYQMTHDENLKKKLLAAHIPAVIEIAKKNYRFGDFLEIGDLVDAGFFGLNTAFDKFDLGKGVKFMTYAAWWIRQAILLEKANFDWGTRIPVHMYNKVVSLKKRESEFTARRGRRPDVKELAGETHKTEKEVREIQGYISSKETSSTYPSLKDYHSTRQFEEVDARLMVQGLFEGADLSRKEKDIIHKSLGLGMDNHHIGRAYYGVTGEAIRQKKEVALEKIMATKEKLFA